jgi:cytoplasmic iron level regulating protein YaaA (DUF328/UPF0246 family)
MNFVNISIEFWLNLNNLFIFYLLLINIFDRIEEYKMQSVLGALSDFGERYLEQKGYKVLRFWNNEIDNNLDGVIEKILYDLNLII